MELPNFPDVSIDATKIWVDNEESNLKYTIEADRAARTQRIVAADDPECTGVAVLIETRKHPSTEAVLRTFVHFLQPHRWGLAVFCSKGNAAFVREIVKDWKHVTVVQLDLPEKISMPEYNKLMTSEDLWSKMPHENLLMFQTDCTLLTGKPFAPGSEFLKYDYIGAPWFAKCPKTQRVYTPTMTPSWTVVDEDIVCQLAPNHVGNGGLSFRKKSAMLECVRKHPWVERPMTIPMPPCVQPADGVIKIASQNEDTYFAMALRLLRKNIAPRAVAMKFSCEIEAPFTIQNSDEEPVVAGLHKVFAYQPPDVVRALISQSRIKFE